MSLPTSGELYRAYQNSTKKRFGQHFLTDDAILGRIAELADIEDETPVLEIGPGCGTLTRHLMARSSNVTAIELDKDLITFLTESLVPHGLNLIPGDAMKVPLDIAPGTVVVSNLPYNVGTHITFRLLEHGDIARLILMFQKEVADRICADEQSKAYGALSVRVAAHAESSREFVLEPGAFRPPPKVRSAVVKLTPRATDLSKSQLEAFHDLVTTSFGKRRKMLSTSLKGKFDKALVQEALEDMGAKSTARPEELSYEQFCELARRLTT